MDNNKYKSACRMLLLAGLLGVGGCAVQHGTAPLSARVPAPPAPLADGGIDTGAPGDAGEGDVPAAAESDADSDGEQAVLWGRFRTSFYFPDPEHITLEATPAPGARAVPQEAVAGDVEARTDTPAGEKHDRPHDLWDRLRAGFSFPSQEHPRIRAERRWYADHPEYIARTVERARPYLYLIIEALERRGMPTEIALLPIVESAYQPFAYSHGRAAGIWQFIPATARHYGLKQNWWYDGRRDILASTRAALDYLQNLQRDFDGDWLLALAAYNSGAGTVRKAIRRNRQRGRATDFWSLRLPRETRAYVPKLLALADIFAAPDRYGIALAELPDTPLVTLVDTSSQIDLARAAELSGLPIEELYRLNPAFNRWATDPEGPHRLLLPLDKAAAFAVALARIDPASRIRWTRHRIREGETLGHIAVRYRTTVDVLRQINHIKGHMIRAGHSLIIPVATRDLSSYTLSAEQRRKSIQEAPRRGRKILYTVRRGDTLWDIARAHRTSVRQLAAWNAMSPRDLLRPGQRLVIWKPTQTAKAGIDGLLNRAHPLSNVTRRINYVVRKGDSLARISQRFNVKISELRSWNSLPKDKYLQPGQRLTLYIDVTDQTENI